MVRGLFQALIGGEARQRRYVADLVKNRELEGAGTGGGDIFVDSAEGTQHSFGGVEDAQGLEQFDELTREALQHPATSQGASPRDTPSPAASRGASERDTASPAASRGASQGDTAGPESSDPSPGASSTP